jgi:hypothetical protein
MIKSRGRLALVATAVALTAALGTQAHAANFKITSAVMAKKYAGGKTSGITSKFKVTDRTIYCVVKVNKILKNVKARFVWTAVNVKGQRPNSVFLDKSGTLKIADIIWGSAALKSNWPTGSYKVDVHVNGEKIKTLNYSIR